MEKMATTPDINTDSAYSLSHAMSTIPFNNFYIPFGSLSVVLTVVLNGALVRYQANYTPHNRVHDDLDLEDSKNRGRSVTSPEVNGVFRMLGRVGRLEGWSGYLKGLVPTFLLSILAFNIVLHFVRVPLHALSYFIDNLFPEPYGSIFHKLYYSFPSPASIITFLLVSVPSSIIINRAICTPYKLPFFSPKMALNLLLDEQEQELYPNLKSFSRFWRLLALPQHSFGLVSAYAIHGVVKVVLLVILPDLLQEFSKRVSLMPVIEFVVKLVGKGLEDEDGVDPEVESVVKEVFAGLLYLVLVTMASLLIGSHDCQIDGAGARAGEKDAMFDQ
ncbi:hypothetical protein K435DRAFT_855293 [Dendrothele bispora CBS 962.96]|uniref:Mitochondrial carrier n=1 Tax=Dendrothele bispora (strain CBS 962.96) TaxID=1314807 RepID=A0A4S8MBD3_DENBC|nr:hypothetical protein K435DRAFT_855293 [Dendrothele bispora CBS 962.96]